MSKNPEVPITPSEDRFLPFQKTDSTPPKDLRLQPINRPQFTAHAPEWQKYKERAAAEERVIKEVNRLRSDKEFLKRVLSSLESKVKDSRDVSGLTTVDAKLLQMYAQMGQLKSEFIQQQLEILSRAVQEFNISQGQLIISNEKIQSHFFKEKGFMSALKCIEAFLSEAIDTKYPEILPHPEQRQVYVNDHLDAKNKIDLVVLDAQENGSFIAHLVQVKSSEVRMEEQASIIDHHRSCTDHIARLGQLVESPKVIEVPSKEIHFKNETEYRSFVERIDMLILDYLVNNSNREQLVAKLFKELRSIEPTDKNPRTLEGRTTEVRAYLRWLLKNPLLTTATQADIHTLLKALDEKVVPAPIEETKYAPIDKIYSVTYVPGALPNIQKLYQRKPLVGAADIPLIKIKTASSSQG